MSYRPAHQPGWAPRQIAAAHCQRILTECLLVINYLQEPALEGAVRSQCFPYRKTHRQYCEPSEHDDHVVEAHTRGQPVSDLKIPKLSAPHISNRAILLMMRIPLPSIVRATPSRSRPRMSV